MIRKRPFIALAVSWTSLQQYFVMICSPPIVIASFDSPHRQIENSRGDNWTPTWAWDDALYTGCDDGNSFGGVTTNPISFGKLEGSDPYHLKGTTINGMTQYQEGPLFEPVDRHIAGGVTYKLEQCDAGLVGRDSVCLHGPSGNKQLFANRSFGPTFFISLANDASTVEFGFSSKEYAFVASRAGLIGGEDKYYIGRISNERLSRADPRDWTFLGKDGSWTENPAAAEPMVNARFLDSSGSNWKITSTYSVDGTLYMFIVRLFDYRSSGDPRGRLVAKDANIIKSTDGGRTWIRSAQKNRREPMFPGRRFGAPYFVWYGKDGASRVDNGDTYVYAISNDGYWDSGDNYILGRVLRSRLSNLSPSDWSFFQSGDGMEYGSWTPEVTKAQPVLWNPKRSGMTGATYIEGLRRYVLISWHYPSQGWRDVTKNGDTYTILEFFEAPHPWGPWTRFQTFKTKGLGWYTPIVGQRFQSFHDATVHAFIYATALNTRSRAGTWEHNQPLYKLNYLPITFSTTPISHRTAPRVDSR